MLLAPLLLVSATVFAKRILVRGGGGGGGVLRVTLNFRKTSAVFNKYLVSARALYPGP